MTYSSSKLVMSGDIQDIRDYFERHPDFEIPDSDHWNMTPLNLAAYYRDVAIVAFFINEGADLNAADSSGDTPLVNAVLKKKIDVFHLLLRAGADVSVSTGGYDRLLSLAQEKGQEFVEALDIIKKDPLQVSFNRAVGNRVLQEIYDFEALERITFIREKVTSPVESCLREDFAKIESSTGLEKAYAEHLKRGGARTKAEVFSSAYAFKAIQRKGNQ